MSLTGFKITSDSPESLRFALKIPFHDNTAFYWREDEEDGLPRLRFWGYKDGPEGWVKLVAPLSSPEQAAEMIEGWLKLQQYGREPDTDGSAEKGWEIYRPIWGYVAAGGAFLAVKPAWIVYGK